MKIDYSNPLSKAFTTEHKGMTLADASPKTRLKKLKSALFNLANPPCSPGWAHICGSGGWNW
ncbi:hypothetical protein [Pseudomonas putida]|uniref:hypothetical protein n=1 Tax=Pseudomonas putida TaxID=303 RepID=UPI0012696264|nr:hypothetical protein [Pseudomonas putida]